MMDEVDEREYLHRSEQKTWIEKWLKIFVKNVMIVMVSEWESLHRNEPKR